MDYNISIGPFLSFEIEIGDGPGPKLANNDVRKHPRGHAYLLLSCSTQTTYAKISSTVTHRNLNICCLVTQNIILLSFNE